jgi:sugar-specific transcriptional regulator TrmB
MVHTVNWLTEDITMARLVGIGLTNTEAKVYITLLKGEADARSISERSGVPYSKIHTVLSRLVSKFLVIDRGGRPTIYATKRPSEGLLDYKRAIIADLEVKLKGTFESLAELEAEKDSEKSDIWIIKNQEDILRRTYELLNKAKKEVKLALPVAPDWVVAALKPVLMRLRSERISLRLLLTYNFPANELKKLSDIANIKCRDKMFGGGIIVDNDEALLFIGSNDGVVNLAIWSNHTGLVQVARTYFDYLWESAG